MEHEVRYASQGQANLNTVLGSIGTAGATGILGNLGGLFGSNVNCSANMYTRYDAEKDAKIAALESDKKHLESTIYTDAKISDVYERLNLKIGAIESQLCDQKVYNATCNAAVSCIQGQVNQMMSLFSLKIPNSSVCPGWGDVNVTVAPATAATT